MRKLLRKALCLALGAAVVVLFAAGSVGAKVEGDTIIIGSAISFTGKYSTNGVHASNGYNLSAKLINEAGGVKVGGKSYKLKIKYYDDESTPARTASSARASLRAESSGSP